MSPRFSPELPDALRRAPIAIAHRGGALLPENLGKENSLEAFANAVDLGFDYLETDLRTSKDGEVFAFHDPDLRRTLGAAVRFSSLTAEEVRDFRMADSARVASLGDLLAEFPDAVFNIDFKDDAGIERGLAQIDRYDAAERVIIASFSHRRLARVRSLAPHLFTSASQAEVARMRFGRRLHPSAPQPIALQVPVSYRGFPILTRRLIARAHRFGIQVHVWTIDDPREMHRLFDLGADGIITDRPDILKNVLTERGQWPTAS